MKKIIIFGYGKIGKDFLRIVEDKYSSEISVVAISDNSFNHNFTRNNQMFICPKYINDMTYDDIYVCTVYCDDIVIDLVENYGIDRGKIRTIEDPAAIYLGDLIKQRNIDEVNPKFRGLYQYAQKQNVVPMFCYEYVNDYKEENVEVFFDEKADMYYGIISGKKVYLSKRINSKKRARRYLNSILIEQDYRSPHFYNARKYLHKGCTCIDVGAAEGIFALESIDTLNKVYMVEADAGWIPALQQTYVDNSEKIEIIEGFASDISEGKEIRLDDCIKDKIDVIKIDIEGAEKRALDGMEGIIRQYHPVMEVCTYHNCDDYEIIKEWLERRGYHTYPVDGYMLCMAMWEIDNECNYDFRHGVIIGEYAND